jgi:uncharacterized lipoprotein YbaY
LEINGLVSFRQPPDHLAGAIVRVRLIDTTLIDAPSETVCEQAIDLGGDGGGGPTADELSVGIPFRLAVGDLEPRRRYEVAVHVDHDRSGLLSPGDYLNKASHPIAPDLDRVDTEITVERI